MKRLQNISPVWFLNGALVILAVLGGSFVVDMTQPLDVPNLSWPVMSLAFYVAEVAVLHLRFRRDAQSFSMSEIALTVGLFFASPVNLLIGSIVGQAAALIFNRRQPPMKLVFNISQFVLQAVGALATFHAILGEGDPLGPRAWGAALVANLVAFGLSDISVNSAIRFAGGQLSSEERWTARWIGSAAALMNTVLGVVIVLVWSTRPAAVFLALAPPVMLYLAYLAYTSQRAQQARVEALHQTADSLLSARSLPDVVGTASEQARSMFEAELAEVALYATETRDSLRAVATAADGVKILRPEDAPGSVASGEALLLKGSSLRSYLSSDAFTPDTGMVASIDGESGPLGYIVVINPLSDVSSFDPTDLTLLGTLTSQIGPVIENERLGGELAALSQLVESRNEVLASVSHEVRSPLATVVSAAATLESRMGELTLENRQLLVDMIRKNSQELTELVDDLLVAAKGDSANENIETQQVDPLTEVVGVVAALVELSGEAPIKGTAPAALADPTRLRQILRNLLTNAARYGGSEIWVELEEHELSVSIAVCDNGEGVPAHLAMSIFDPYVSAHPDETQPQALGLGLAISRRLARLMGGEVTYEHKAGTTRFVLTLQKA